MPPGWMPGAVAPPAPPLHATEWRRMINLADDELDHISTWAKTNNLRLNTSKSKELIIYGRKRCVPPPLIIRIERVTNMKILGVVVGCDLSARLHNYDPIR